MCFAFARSARRRPPKASLIGLVAMLCVLFGALFFGANLSRLTRTPARYGLNFDLAVGAGETVISA